MNDKHAPSSSLVEALAGFTAGIVSTLAVHPLDIVKTRLQVDRFSSSRIGGSFHVVREVSRNEGGIPAFYRGLTPNIFGNSISWGLYFFWYSNIKDALYTFHGSRKEGLGSLDYVMASGTAGALTAILTNPIWVIKTRMLSTGSGTPAAYASFTAGFRQIYLAEGVKGFYRGLVPALFGVSHGALQFMAYEQLKKYRSRITRSDVTPHTAGIQGGRELRNMDYVFLSSLSKIFAGCATYPYQVLRARLQTYDAAAIYQGVGDVILQIWRKEGIEGFYKGIGPNLLRVLPSTCVTFLVYENARIYLPILLRDV